MMMTDPKPDLGSPAPSATSGPGAPGGGPPPPFVPPPSRRGRRAAVGPPVLPPAVMESAPPTPDAISAAWQSAGWFLVSIILGFLGYEVDCRSLPKEEADEDAKALLPIVMRSPFLARAMTWIGAPAVVLRRVMQHAKRKVKPEKQASKEGIPDNVRPLGSTSVVP